MSSNERQQARFVSGPSIAPSFGTSEKPTDDERDIKRPTYASMELRRAYSLHPSGPENREVRSWDSKFNSEYRLSASPSIIATEEPTIESTNIKRLTAANTQPTVVNFVSAKFSLLFENDDASFVLDEDPDFQFVMIDAVSRVLCESIDLFEIVGEEESQDINLCLNYTRHVHHTKPGSDKDEEVQNENENDDDRHLTRVMMGGNDRGPTAKFIESNGIEFRSVNVAYEVIEFRKDEDILSLRELVDTSMNESLDNSLFKDYLVSNDKRILEISRVGEEMQAFESYFQVYSADNVDEVPSTEGTYTQLETTGIQPIRIAGIFLLVLTCGCVFILLRTTKKRSIERLRAAQAAPRSIIDRLLLAAPNAICIKSYHGSPPLHSATKHKHFDAIELLVDAYPEAVREGNKIGTTPKHPQQMAVLANEESINKFLGAPVAR